MPQPSLIQDPVAADPPKNGRRIMEQASLLQILAPARSTAGLAGVMPEIRARMNVTAKAFPAGRRLLVDEIVATAQRENIALTPGGGKTLTPEQFDKVLQHKDGKHEPSFGLILCFCLATGDAGPLEPVWEALGLTVIPAEDKAHLEYGKACAAYAKAQKLKKQWEARL